jgi:hypothetical protein
MNSFANIMPHKHPATTKNFGQRAHGLCERNLPDWYDRTLQLGLENIANPANLAFGLLHEPSLTRRHIPFHLQKEASLEAAIVSEKVINSMIHVRDSRMQSASMSSSGSSENMDPTQICCLDTGVAQWSSRVKTSGLLNSSIDSRRIPGTDKVSKCNCNALKLLGACETCGSNQACRFPIDTHSDDEIDRAFELIKLRRENMPLGTTPVFAFRRKAAAGRLSHAGVPRHVLHGKF